MSSTVHIAFLPQQVTNQNQRKCSQSMKNEPFPRLIPKGYFTENSSIAMLGGSFLFIVDLT